MPQAVVGRRRKPAGGKRLVGRVHQMPGIPRAMRTCCSTAVRGETRLAHYHRSLYRNTAIFRTIIDFDTSHARMHRWYPSFKTRSRRDRKK